MHIYYTNSQNPLFIEAFINRGNWREYKEGDKKIDFHFRDIKFPDPKTYPEVKIKLENFIQKMDGRDKYNLVNSFLKSENKNMVMNQIKFNPNNITDNVLKFIKKDKIYIAKPINSYQGKGIIIIPDLKTFNKKRKYFKEYAPANKYYAAKHKKQNTAGFCRNIYQIRYFIKIKKLL